MLQLKTVDLNKTEESLHRKPLIIIIAEYSLGGVDEAQGLSGRRLLNWDLLLGNSAVSRAIHASRQHSSVKEKAHETTHTDVRIRTNQQPSWKTFLVPVLRLVPHIQPYRNHLTVVEINDDRWGKLVLICLCPPGRVRATTWLCSPGYSWDAWRCCFPRGT